MTQEDIELLESKRTLYKLLLNLDREVTSNEIDLMYSLAKDNQIQDFINKKLKEEINQKNV